MDGTISRNSKWTESAWPLNRSLGYKSAICGQEKVRFEERQHLGLFSPICAVELMGDRWEDLMNTLKVALYIRVQGLCRRKGHVLCLKGRLLRAKGRQQADPTGWPLSRLVGRQPLLR